MIKKKGEYGYRKYFKIKNGIMIGFFIIVILVLFIASKHTKENMSRILLVSSILMVLPMANLLSPFLVVFKYSSYIRYLTFFFSCKTYFIKFYSKFISNIFKR